jgi:hypothetical protein
MQSRKFSDIIHSGDAAYLPSGASIQQLPAEPAISQRDRDEITRSINKEMTDGGFPTLHMNAHLSGSVMEGCFPQGPAWAEKLATLNMCVGRKGCIVALVGPRGTGKTQMATSASHRFAFDQMARRRFSKACRYARAMELFMSVKDSYSASTSERDSFDAFTRPLLLVLDEVQVRNESKWEDNALTFLLDTRYGDGKRTILISNQTVDGFTESIGDSVASRITETGAILPCDWPSFRGMEP